MRRPLLILSLLSVSLLLFGCGERATTVTNANANGASNMTGANSSGTGANAGSGPQTQGIGANGGVNGNTYTAPPGFNKNGDRGSASSVGNTP
ncbi:MAG TPA: hypothetical protein VF791_08390 [Pyrinomonadaceae bacterium]